VILMGGKDRYDRYPIDGTIFCGVKPTDVEPFRAPNEGAWTPARKHNCDQAVDRAPGWKLGGNWIT
jgi:hypothetical protein